MATPIGHAEDITLRALKTLSAADAIACEDTRVTAKLLARHGIERPLLSYHEHNAERMRPVLLERLRRGETLALVSDAGTPLISDPGFKLVRAALEEGLPVTTVPGPSAPLAALLLSGLPSDRFLFAGFLPPKAAARRTALAEFAEVKASLVFFESAPRLAGALADMAAVLGPRPAAVARELTKLFEEVRRGSLAELAARYAEEGPPRGELVVVVGPPVAEPAPEGEALDRQIETALASMSIKDASAAVAAATGLPRRAVYARALTLAGRG
ncbi:MAG TPA: 16S rRNA (cytidine(1402)-2'-O)-methyltransferase [Stellaceae bacterium]|nr:16S rRNA (cytidine(1402)-2'-O)-methyltransferase [Stellaceae bacterium]